MAAAGDLQDDRQMSHRPRKMEALHLLSEITKRILITFGIVAISYLSDRVFNLHKARPVLFISSKDGARRYDLLIRSETFSG
jgi:hypothetical protein